MSIKHALLTIALIAAPCTFISALDMDYSIGARLGVGLGASRTNPFVAIDPATQERENPVVSRAAGLLSNHVNGSVMIYGDIGFLPWLAITPELSFHFGSKTKTGVDDPDLNLLNQSLSFMEFELDVLAKFRLGWLYFGVGPGFSITTPPKFKDKDLQDLYKSSTKMRFDFIMAIDLGLNVPLGQERKHHLTFNTRAAFNVSGMVGLGNATKRWNQNNLNNKDQQIRGVTPVRGTFYVGYMYKF